MGNSGIKKLFFPGDMVESKFNNFYDLSAVDMDLNEVSFENLKNKIILCVNVSSQNEESQQQMQNILNIQEESHNLFMKSQFQQQQEQKNQKKAKQQNTQHPTLESQLQILCFPTSQFNNEPGTFKEMKQFYNNIANQDLKQNNNLKIFGKVEVNGYYTHPVYKFLRRNSELYDYKAVSAYPLMEDFCKFLIDKEGNVVRFYRKNVSNEQIQQDINKLIGE